jgi:hypothetical protein
VVVEVVVELDVDAEVVEVTPGPLERTAAAATPITTRTMMPASTLLPMAERPLWGYKFDLGGVASDICVGESAADWSVVTL